MPTLHYIASLATSLFLIGLTLVLAGPAFDLEAFGARGGLGAGALLQFVVMAVILLSVLSIIGDSLKWYSARKAGRDPGEPIAPPRHVVLVGGGVLLLLAAYVFAWRPLPFPLITVVFVALVSGLIGPTYLRSKKGLLTIGLMAVLFSVGVWLVFTYALKVPLR